MCEVLLVADQAAMAAGVNAKRKALESGARLFRLVRMFSFAVRVPTIVEEARQALAKGEKNFVVVDSTFEAALHDVNRRGLPKTFAGLVMREVECAREPGSGEESGTKRKVPLERFSDGGRRYRELMQRLATEVFDLPASPIDFIANELRRDGATVGEITGRKVEMKEVEGELELTPRGRQERNELLAQFNAGTLDALIVNRAGCNGISAHADPTFADQRRRAMIIGQEALDVNELMQMLGRVMRFGQTCEPRYVFVHTPLALEQRAVGRLRQKLNSLNAHTRGDGDNEVTLTTDLPPDLTDEHADVAVAAVLRKEPELARHMGVGVVPEGTRPKDGDAASATLRFALLPNRDAEDLCEQIEEELRVHNAPDSPGASGHRHQVEDLRAVVREEREWLPAPAGNALVPKVILSHATRSVREVCAGAGDGSVNCLGDPAKDCGVDGGVGPGGVDARGGVGSIEPPHRQGEGAVCRRSCAVGSHGVCARGHLVEKR